MGKKNPKFKIQNKKEKERKNKLQAFLYSINKHVKEKNITVVSICLKKK